MSPGIVALLWINVALIILTTTMRADGFDRFAAGAALVIVASATVGWIRDRTGPTTRIVTAMAHAATVALLVFAFSGSPLQIDMHMYFFASLAICAAWIDWRAIVGYAALVSVHHLLLYFVSAFAVFPQSSDLSRVLLHAVGKRSSHRDGLFAGFRIGLGGNGGPARRRNRCGSKVRCLALVGETTSYLQQALKRASRHCLSQKAFEVLCGSADQTLEIRRNGSVASF
ncbi:MULTISPECIES: hypothetical protein [unclassified Sinorhizobium]|uniref:hypothetical protein n=1 Tax=unclassified Sinorhizobium TaxID=2613772 RepID=UPI0024C267A8|nr:MULTISPECIES: hypothetical protein [unclassified Sinorhizobium]MDK1378380.1 hypothetical protein [Sinorhizobium sp. 6-70]MDK1482697.1 hypothetical protein [Sinorhizobium sp. 6-117]